MSRKLDGDLSDAEEGMLNEHRISCGRCRQKFASYERLRERLRAHTLDSGAHELYSALAGAVGAFHGIRFRIAAAAAAFLIIAGVSVMPFLMRTSVTVTSVSGVDTVDYHLTRFLAAGASDASDSRIVYEPLESFVAFTSR